MTKGSNLLHALQYECEPQEFKSLVKKKYGRRSATFLRNLPSFIDTYQEWYSEARAVVKQLIVDRLPDFVRHYEKPKTRKAINFESYTIEDCLQGLVVTNTRDQSKVVGREAAIPHFRQQLRILGSAKQRFESSLFDLRQLVQADLFDNELDASRELAKHKFTRAAGALAGVVLERHLSQVCASHHVVPTKKAPTISDFNDALKAAQLVEIPQWRFVQHLADIRNLCDHSKGTEPTVDQIDDLVNGTAQIIKAIL